MDRWEDGWKTFIYQGSISLHILQDGSSANAVQRALEISPGTAHSVVFFSLLPVRSHSPSFCSRLVTEDHFQNMQLSIFFSSILISSNHSKHEAAYNAALIFLDHHPATNHLLHCSLAHFD